jgi:AraC-like DNA-binding protein
MPARPQETTPAPRPAPPAVTVPRAPEVFATSGVPDARRVELWESHNAAALIGLDVRAPGLLEATEVNVRLPRARLARVSGSAHAVERTAAVIDRCPADSVAAYLTLRGDARFTWPGGRYALRPGDALVCETDRPFAREFPRGLAELVVTVPRAALADRAGVSRLPAPVVVSFGGSPAGRAARADGADGRYARALARIAGRATRARAPLGPDERTVLDLVAVLAGGRDAVRATAHRAAALCYIEEHLTDPGLDAGQIAAAAGLSERQLSRVFAADGTSVPRHILSRRLQLAYAVLAARPPGRAPAGRAGPGETVADVAVRCGFTSVAYFSHTFRSHFGLRAGDLRRGGHPAEAVTGDGGARRRPAPAT